MQIQVLGTGCTTCKRLYDITKKAVEELGLEIEVEYITDITKIIELGLISTPVIAVDGNVILNGFTGDIERIKELILNSQDAVVSNEESCCEKCECDSEDDDKCCSEGCECDSKDDSENCCEKCESDSKDDGENCCTNCNCDKKADDKGSSVICTCSTRCC